MDIGIAHFNQVLSNEEKIEVKLGDKKYIIPTLESTYGLNAGSWIKLFSMALILRDKKKQESLLEILPAINEDDLFFDNVLKYFGIIFNPPIDTRIKEQCIKKMMDQSKTDMGIHIGLNGNMRKTVKGRSESLTRLSFPLITLYEHIQSKEAEPFNISLENYLLDKKKFIVKKKWNNSRDYWVDFLTLACCSYAKDNGIPISVESEYIPSWIHQEDWANTNLIF